MDYEKAKRGLPIDKHRLDDELQTHADMHAEVHDALAKANSRHLAAKDNLARTEARVYATVKDGGVKLNKEEVDGRVTRDASRIAAWEEYQRAREDYERWLGMAESWRQRSYSLSKLAELFSANYFSLTLSSLVDHDVRPAWQRDEHALPARKAAEVTPEPEQRRPLIRRRPA